jgi:hypothetical protein
LKPELYLGLTTMTKRAARLLQGLIAIESLFVIVYAIDALLREKFWLLHALFDLDGEANIPTWFSSCQLFLIGVTLFLPGVIRHKAERPSRPFLLVLSACFVILSLDETAQLHERITQWIGRRYIDWLPEFMCGSMSLAVSILAVAIFILRLALRDLSAIWRWSPRLSLSAMAGVCISVFGGVVMEAIGYKFMKYGTPLYKVEVAIEESMEMLGASVILYFTVSLASSVIKSIILEA